MVSMRDRRASRVVLVPFLLGLSCSSIDGPISRNAEEPDDLPTGTLLDQAPEAELPLLRETVRAEAPFDLTTSDGSGLKLVSMRSSTVIEDPLALTELELEFDNPEARTLEGRFSITLPPGASISRFAMEIDGKWQEGEVVEKQRARKSYETFLHQRKDPALLEQGAGNQFSARVFPIPAKARKRLVLTYAEVLDQTRPFQVRLRGLPKMEQLAVRVVAGGKEIAATRERDFAPTSDLLLDDGKLVREAGVVSNGMAVVRGRVPASKAVKDDMTAALLLVDTSAGRVLDLQDELRAVLALVKQMPPDARVVVAGFDQETAVAFDGAARDLDDADLDALRKRQAFGASDFGRALAWVKVAAAAKKLTRLVVFTDGIASSGASSDKALVAKVAALKDAGVERVDAIAVGGIRSDETLSAIVKSGARSGVVIDIDAEASTIARRLGHRTLGDVPVEIAGATWQSPKKLAGVQPGDEFVVFAELGVGARDAAKVRVAGEDVTIPLRAVESRELVARAHAVARIAEIEKTTEPSDEEAQKQVIALSTQHRVLSRQTAMVVLESDGDYGRFGIDRTATVDILAIDGARIVTRKGARLRFGDKVADATRQPAASSGARRAPRPAQALTAEPAPFLGRGPLVNQVTVANPTPAQGAAARGNMWGDEIGDAFGAGGLGLSGVGEGGGGRSEGIGLGSIGQIGQGAGTGTGQGFGSGSGRLGGSHRSSAPRIRAGATEVSGRFPPEVIQRIVRQNFGRFRLCYENALRKDPNTTGRVSVRFTIALDGSVKGQRVDSSTIGSAEMSACVANAFTNLSFPQPEGGTVTVVYPIQFAPPGAPVPASEASPAPAPQRFFGGEPPEKPETQSPYVGRFKSVMDRIAAKDGEKALAEALAYKAESPSDVLAFVAVGEAAEATQRPRLAARAYGSILDLWSYRVEMKRFAAQRLERIATAEAIGIAADAYASAVTDRPDHPSGYRMLAYAALKAGAPAVAFETIEKALKEKYPDGRYAGVIELMRQDSGILAAAWIKQEPSLRDEILKRVAALGTALETEPSTRFVLSWETDANDVDLHVTDAYGEHASYQHTALASGGHLVADVTTGYGPEGFVIPGKAKAFPYRLSADYYSRGVMGFGMGKVQIVRHDGRGNVELEERPFVIQSEKGRVDLGVVDAAPQTVAKSG